MAFYIDNAISWAQFRVRGGWKNLFMVTFGYAVAAIFFIVLFYELAEQPRDKRFVLSAATTMILALQIVLELLVCSAMIASSIRRDIANRQIESNRLMPLSPTHSIVGYLGGGSLHILGLALINLLMGCVISLVSGNPVNDWLVINLLLLLFSVTIWCAMAMAAFISRAVFAVILLVCATITFSGGFIFILLPALLVFCTPMHGRTIFQTSSQWRLEEGAIVGIASQFLLSLLFIRGAARKYADAGAQTLTLASALALLGIWAGLSWFGITYFFEMRPANLMRVNIDWRVLAVGAIASCLLLALLPVATIAWSDIRRQQLRRAGENIRSQWWLFWLALPVSLLFATAPLTSKLSPNIVFFQDYYNYATYSTPAVNNPPVPNLPLLSYGKHPNPFMIVVACAIFLIEAYYLMRLLYPVLRRANLLIALLVILSWFVPLIADLVYYGMQPGNVQPRMDQFALFSPIGTMIQALDAPVKRVWPGLLFQGCLALIPLALFLFIQTRRQIADSRGGFPIETVPALPAIPTPES